MPVRTLSHGDLCSAAMTFLSQSEVDRLHTLRAPSHTDFAAAIEHLGYGGGEAGVCEVAYYGLQPRQVLSLDMALLSPDGTYTKPQDWSGDVVYQLGT